MNNTPYSTIILNTYNRANLLIGAVQSVLAQSCTDYELIIVDDASTDDTEQTVAQWLDSEAKQPNAPTISYLRLSTNVGINAARNAAIEQARGEIVVFLDDDDRFTPDFLDHVQRAMQGAPQSAAFALPGRRTLRPSATGDILLSETDYGCTSTTLLTKEKYLDMPLGGASGLVVRRTAARAIGGFPAGFVSGGDVDFMLRLAARWDMLIIPQATLLVYNHERPQVSRSLLASGVASEKLADLHAETLRRFPKTRARFYRSGARMYYGAKARPQGRHCLWKAFKVAPLSYKTWQLFLLLEVSDLLPSALRDHLFRHTRHGNQAT